jgi:uncharacterized membrane protein YfcA
MPDLTFFLVSCPAVMLYGIAKGGFGGSMAVLAVPLMALVMSPTQAAAILLPILVVMDILVVKTYWGVYDRQALLIMLPGAVLGIAIGYLTASAMNDDYMRMLIGMVALAFGLQSLLRLGGSVPKTHKRLSGGLFGALAGFTSFSIHAGGPPFQMYLVPRRLPPLVYAGTSGLFFAAVNALKLGPYYALGQFTGGSLLQSLVLLPLAPVGVRIGHWLVRRTDPRLYYGVISFFLLVVGVRLLWAGLEGVGAL